MAYAYTWNAAFEADPADGDDASGGALDIRQTKAAIRERMEKDHYMAVAGTDADHGEHKWATLREQATKPDALGTADKIYLYSKETDGGEAALFLEDENADEIRVMGFVGEVRQILGSTIPTGWLGLKGETIGSAASGADNAAAKFEDLYTLLYDELSDSEFPITGGRGANAAADWAANKPGTMPDARSRILVGAGQNTYEYLAYTSGGTHEVLVGDTLTGATSTKTCIVDEVVLLSGTWAGGDAAGYFIVHTVSGVFQAENLNEGANGNVCTIAGDTTPMSDRTLGDTGGSEIKDIAHVHDLGSHVHTGPSHVHTVDVTVAGTPLAGDAGGYTGSYDGTVNTGAGGTGNTGAAVGDTASGGATTKDVMNPWLAVTIIIKW